MLVTTWLAGGQAAAYQPGLDLPAYRDAVTELAASFERSGAGGSTRLAARVLSRRLTDPDIADVLGQTPSGSAGALERLLLEVRGYRPSPRSSATSLASLHPDLAAGPDRRGLGGAASPPTRPTPTC